MTNHRYFLLIVLLFSLTASYSQTADKSSLDTRIATGRVLADQGNYRASADTLLQLLNISVKTNDLTHRIQIGNLLGESFANMNECQRATSAIERNLRLIDSAAIKDQNLLAETYYYLGRAKGGCARQFDEGIVWLRKSKDIYESLESPLKVADVFSFTAFIFEAKGSYDSAAFYCDQTLSIRRKHLPENDLELSHPLFIMAKVHDNKGEIDKSIRLHEQALSIRLQHLDRNHPTISNSFHSIGIVYQKLGNYKRALQYFEQALEIRKKTLGPDHINVAGSYYIIGNLYHTLLQYRQAIHYIEEGNRIAEKRYTGGVDILPTYQALLTKLYALLSDPVTANVYRQKTEYHLEKNLPADHPYRGIVLALLGEYYGIVGNTKLAIEHYRAAIPIFQKAYGANSIREADVVSKLALIQLEKDSFDEGVNALMAANNLYDNKLGMPNPRTAGNLFNLGKQLNSRGDHRQALGALQKSLIAISFPFNDSVQVGNNPSADWLENKSLALKIVMEKAKAFQNLYLNEGKLTHLNNAWSSYQYGVDLYDQLLKTQTLESSTTDLVNETRSYFDLAMETLHELFQKTNDTKFQRLAWALSEKSKAVQLLAKWHDQQSMFTASVPDSLIEKERDILIEIAFHQSNIYQSRKKGDSIQLGEHETKLFAATERHDRLKKGLARQFPTYYRNKYDASSADLAYIQKKLKDKILISYYVTEKAIFSFVVRPDEISWKRMEKPATLETVIRENHRALSDIDFISAEPEKASRMLTETSSQLFDWLIGKELSGPIVANRIIVVPDKILSTINFGTLIDSSQSENTFLLQRCDIAYAHSASFLWNNWAASRSSKTFGGFAPSYNNFSFTREDSTRHPITSVVVRDGHLPLPGAQQEVQQIASVMGGEQWLNDEASETTFKNEAPHYKVLHLAMHSLLNDERPEYSELVFNSEEDSINDGFLTVSEIYNMKINAAMVVLSSCSSGVGTIQTGEGPISLARAFHYAGASSVVMSLWKVPDNVTSQIMLLFYNGVKEGMEKDAALRRAQLQYLELQKDPLLRHPFFWSGFVVMGSTEPLPGDPWMKYLLGGIGVLIVGAIGYYAHMRRSFRKKIQ